jgi:lipase
MKVGDVTYELRDFPVSGGLLRAGVWGDAGPLVVAAHGITAQHRTWAAVGPDLGRDHRFVGVDLRGRGGSRDLPGPYGTAVHAADIAAVVAHLGEGPVILVGHSLGAMVMAKAARLPGVGRRVVLVDGGPLQPLPAGAGGRTGVTATGRADPVGRTSSETVAAPDQAVLVERIRATIGPAFARLSRVFADRAEYAAFWQPHPAMRPWTDAMTAYLDYDLVPAQGGGWQPACRLAAAERDALDLYNVDGRPEEPLPIPALFLRAERGMLDQPDEPFYPRGYAEYWLPGVTVRDVPDTNHSTITFGAAGAAAVAAAVRDRR